MMGATNERDRPAEPGRPRMSPGLVMAAFCVGGYDDYNNVANGGTDNQNADGANYIMVFAHDRNDFAAAISPTCGESGHEHQRIPRF